MIICSAVKVNGKIYRGHRHSDAIKCAVNCEGKVRMSQEDQGFMTGDNEFVDRKEAYKIAKECGQINIERKNGLLFSEDLY